MLHAKRIVEWVLFVTLNLFCKKPLHLFKRMIDESLSYAWWKLVLCLRCVSEQVVAMRNIQKYLYFQPAMIHIKSALSQIVMLSKAYSLS